jgi:hypothetical protein
VSPAAFRRRATAGTTAIIKELIVALSTRWYAGGRRCRRSIRITSRRNGRAVEAIVVDECDSSSGCRDNVVDASELGRVEGARAQQQR